MLRKILDKIDGIVETNEGFFNDFISIVKAGKELKKLGEMFSDKMEKMKKDGLTQEQVASELMKFASDSLKKIESYNMSPDIEETFKVGFITGVAKGFIKHFGDEAKDKVIAMFNISPDLKLKVLKKLKEDGFSRNRN